MRTLYLLRHAKSSWADRTLADHDRPLAPRGRRDAKRIGEHLQGLEPDPELVLCSSALRTRQTLELVARRGLADATTRLEDSLYGATCEGLLSRLRSVPEPVESVLLIGHNPSLQQLALVLAAAGDELERLEAKFPTGALATLRLQTAWSSLGAGAAELTAYVVPRELR